MYCAVSLKITVYGRYYYVLFIDYTESPSTTRVKVPRAEFFSFFSWGIPFLIKLENVCEVIQIKKAESRWLYGTYCV